MYGANSTLFVCCISFGNNYYATSQSCSVILLLYFLPGKKAEGQKLRSCHLVLYLSKKNERELFSKDNNFLLPFVTSERGWMRGRLRHDLGKASSNAGDLNDVESLKVFVPFILIYSVSFPMFHFFCIVEEKHLCIYSIMIQFINQIHSEFEFNLIAMQDN